MRTIEIRDRKEELLAGKCVITEQIHRFVKATSADRATADDMVQALYNRLLKGLEGPTSLLYWADKFKDVKVFNQYLYHLSKAEWIIAVSKKAGMRNWAEISLNTEKVYKYISRDELIDMVSINKLNRYLLDTEKPTSIIAGGTDVKLPNGTIAKTGLVRFGSARASQHRFKYDTDMMSKYAEEIIKYTAKAMDKLEEKLGYTLVTEEEIDYKSIGTAIVNYHIDNEYEEFTLGRLLNDSRGRSIYKGLTKVFNPVNNKCARALAVCPAYTMKKKELKEVFLFIAEMCFGYNADMKAKEAKGREAYADRYLPKVGNDDIYEVIWLERVYAELDRYYASRVPSKYQWTVPGEIDFSSSNLVLIGCLLNDKTLLTEYMWQIDGLSKLHCKKHMTPAVFGSTANITTSWRRAGLDFTGEQLKIMTHEVSRGKYATANAFKDLIINHANMQEEMVLHVFDEKFRVVCNKYRAVGDITKAYPIYDTATGKVNLVKHTHTHKVADTGQFKRYAVTGLIHNLDGQIMNKLCINIPWLLPIYDACVVPFNQFERIRNIGTEEYERIRANRGKILKNYFNSLNMSGTKFLRDLAKLMELVEPFEDSIDPYHILK